MTAAGPGSRAWVSIVPHTRPRRQKLTFYHVRAVAFLLFCVFSPRFCELSFLFRKFSQFILGVFRRSPLKSYVN